MEQKSDVQYRAEKEYKNSREKFSLLLREVISNAIHAVVIRQSKEESFIPKISLTIDFDEENEHCSIVLKDNGEGFTEQNSNYFNALDKKNKEKENFNFHPLGQGRLAIVYFTDSAEYETVYKNKDGQIFAVNPTCTHLGCLLTWNNLDKTWDCPCHGSRFDLDGNIIETPSVEKIDSD